MKQLLRSLTLLIICGSASLAYAAGAEQPMPNPPQIDICDFVDLEACD
ncbi:MAG: hypothetical protein KUG83_09845 [Gammaproteobacteria bacterium]|nr:hypothetical protein [Gammaproteobacteria bacterium]